MCSQHHIQYIKPEALIEFQLFNTFLKRTGKNSCEYLGVEILGWGVELGGRRPQIWRLLNNEYNYPLLVSKRRSILVNGIWSRHGFPLRLRQSVCLSVFFSKMTSACNWISTQRPMHTHTHIIRHVHPLCPSISPSLSAYGQSVPVPVPVSFTKAICLAKSPQAAAVKWQAGLWFAHRGTPLPENHPMCDRRSQSDRSSTSTWSNNKVSSVCVCVCIPSFLSLPGSLTPP